jgi:hypothetical protein
MNEIQFTPAELRNQARVIRFSAQFAQGRTRIDELVEAQALERRADELERNLSEVGQ